MRSLPHALTIFVSAFLLFTIQLVVAKAILPWFGGTPAVWTTCLVFFQALLTCGYAYAHGAIRWLSPRAQGAVHVVLVTAACGALAFGWQTWGTPLIPDDSWKPLDGDRPVRDILALLTVATALPYLALSSTSPLIQAWFARAFPQRSAVRLYALSNAGSLLGLITYPFVVEPRVGLRGQAGVWSALFALFAASSIVCALRARGDVPQATEEESEPWPGWGACAWWFTLAAVGSMLLMATSNLISQEISTSPLLWMLPLATYLLTFILSFDREKTYHRGVFSWLYGAGMAVTVWELQEAAVHDPRLVLAASLFTLFVGCMICHGELVRSKPSSNHLTLFYLMLSLGGAVGGGFVSLGAPLLFTGFWEMQISQMAVGLLLLMALLSDRTSWLHSSVWPLIPLTALAAVISVLGTPLILIRAERNTLLLQWGVGVLLSSIVLLGVLLVVSRQQKMRLHRGRGQAMLLGLSMLFSLYGAALLITARPFSWTDIAYVRRNFYGVLRVLDQKRTYTLVHGSTFHGWQLLEQPRITTGYYGPGGGVAVAIGALQATRPALEIGVFGLGAGQMAAFLRPSDTLVYYEIDPYMIDVAAGPEALFSFVRDTRGKVSVVRGDARLSLERDTRVFDLLVMDAFSSDSIPVHLLTREAFEMYSRHLKPDGVLLVHISNRYLDLVPLMRRQCIDQGFQVAFVSRQTEDEYHIPTLWTVATRTDAFLRLPQMATVLSSEVNPETLQRPWTDDWSNVFQVLRR